MRTGTSRPLSTSSAETIDMSASVRFEMVNWRRTDCESSGTVVVP